MKICSKGVWDETIPGTVFDENGVSNFCKLQERMMADYPRGQKGKEEWKSFVAQMKAKGKGKRYDCIIGVSGGVDSSYLLHIAHEHGLRPLAVNLDNGFNSDIAVQNIFKVTKALNIDLETYVIEYEEIKDLLKSYMKASLPWVDSPTDLAIKAVMYKYALEEGIRFIIRGNDFRSEGKQPKEWTYSDAKQLKYIHKRFGRRIKLKAYPVLPFRKIIYAGIVKNILDIRPYYYLEYTKQDAKKMLMETYNWKDYGGHHHENIFTKFSMAYWLPEKFGIDKRKINLSAQILSGAITRDEALAELDNSFGSEEELLAMCQYVIKKLDLTQQEFDDIWAAPNRNTFDYPSNYNLIYGLVDKFNPLIKRLYTYTPMSITEREVINNKVNNK